MKIFDIVALISIMIFILISLNQHNISATLGWLFALFYRIVIFRIESKNTNDQNHNNP